MNNIKFYNGITKLSNYYIKKMYNPIILGKENLDINKTYLYIGNHINYKDPALLIYALCNKQVCFMAKKELFDNKLIGYIINNLNAFPIDRNNNDIKAIKTAVRLLRENNNVGIFPEGTRNKDFGEFKKGIPRIALMGKKEIVPYAISGKYKHNKKLILQFGKPIDFKKIDSKESDKYLEDIVKSLILK